MFELDLERRRIRNRNRKGKTLNPAQPAAHLSSQPSPLFPLRPSLFPSLPTRGPALHGPRRRPASPTLAQQPVTPRRPARARLPAYARSPSLPRLAHASGPSSSPTRPCFPLSAKPVPPVSSTPYLPFFLLAPARTELPSLLSGGPPRLGRPTVQFRLRHLLLEVESRARDNANPLCDPFPPRTGPSETAAAILAVAFHTKAAKILA